jgi:pyruvate,water dikinase
VFGFRQRNKTCRLLAQTQGRHVEMYARFRAFLTHNYEALAALARLEQIYHSGNPFGMAQVRRAYAALSEASRGLVQALIDLAQGRFAGLMPVFETIDAEARGLLEAAPHCRDCPLVLPLERATAEDLPDIGAKAGNLARLGNELGLPVPRGFAITARASALFLESGGLGRDLAERLENLPLEEPRALDAACEALRQKVLAAPLPGELTRELDAAYAALEARTRPDVRVAVRSSAVGEDTEASFAGQYSTILNVTREHLAGAYKAVLASKYTPHAVLYRTRHGLDDAETPMCVAVIEMVEAAAAGVAYTRDPADPRGEAFRVAGIWGLGEPLVGGEASADAFVLNRDTGAVLERSVARKETRLVNLPGGDTRTEPVPGELRDRPVLDGDQLRALLDHGLALERFFGRAQDLEWALDHENRLVLLQCRPLGLEPLRDPGEAVQTAAPLLLSGGQTASRGAAAGLVFLAEGHDLADLPENALLVTRTTSPGFAALAGRLRGLVADVGSTASHLASVLREYRVPALVDVREATKVLVHGQAVTLDADARAVYAGEAVEVLAARAARPALAFETPAHRRLRALLDRLSPLNLTDPHAAHFTPEGCTTLHDVIRFAHEKAMKAMFSLPERLSGVHTARLKAQIPLDIRVVDLGGGLREGLTDCDEVRPEDIASVPMRAVWRGFTHPGITWSGSVNLDFRNLFTLFASSAAGLTGPDLPGGESFAVLAADYMNLNAKFGYHFANVDALCGDEAEKNAVSVQFAGGAGNYLGKSLRVSFLAGVLQRLGFSVDLSGDLLEASLSGLDRPGTEQALDQLGRLLGASRLLDVAISRQAQAEAMVEAFFREDYDFLDQATAAKLPGFHAVLGNWSRIEEDGRTWIVQDGSAWLPRLSAGLSGFLTRLVGPRYQEFLDTIGAYRYFPLAVAKGAELADGRLSVLVRPMAGIIDQAGGLALGLRNAGNYFVFRVNAVEQNVMFSEFVDGRRIIRAQRPLALDSGQTYRLEVEVSGGRMRGLVDGRLALEYDAGRPVAGYVGLWTKADSVTRFSGLALDAAAGVRLLC